LGIFHPLSLGPLPSSLPACLWFRKALDDDDAEEEEGDGDVNAREEGFPAVKEAGRGDAFISRRSGRIMKGIDV